MTFQPHDEDFLVGKNVLIVDDEPDIVAGFRRIFERFLPGVKVHVAESVAEGLEAALEIMPDCVVLDYRLGDGNGLDLLAKLREARLRSPVMLVTAYADLDLALEAVNRSHVNYVFPKDAPPEDLLQALNEALVEAHLAA